VFQLSALLLAQEEKLFAYGVRADYAEKQFFIGTEHAYLNTILTEFTYFLCSPTYLPVNSGGF
jgi:hypothetical protein